MNEATSKQLAALIRSNMINLIDAMDYAVILEGSNESLKTSVTARVDGLYHERCAKA